jgi:hypothetical protein
MTVCFALIFVAATTAQAQDVHAVPSQTTFTRMDDSASFQVYEGDTALPKSAIEDYALYAGDSAYTFMVEVSIEEKDGAAVINVEPNPDELEIGSYTLEVETTRGTAEFWIDAPLTALESVLEKAAQARGVSVQQIRKQLGLVTYAPREELGIALPETIHVGRTVIVELAEDPGLYHTWYVNQMPYAHGAEADTFRYTAWDPGLVSIHLVTTNAEGRKINEWHDTIEVVAEHPKQVTLEAGEPVEFRGPDGYVAYEWQVDGLPVPGDKTMLSEFDDAGAYMVECLAMQDYENLMERFRLVRWEVTAK